MLFGSDWPALTPDRWLADFKKIEIKPKVRRLKKSPPAWHGRRKVGSFVG